MNNERKNTDLPVSDLVHDLWPQPVEDQKSFKAVTEDDIELSDEEVELAIRTLKRKKAAEIRTRQYWEQVNKPKVYPKLTAEQVRHTVLRFANKWIPNFSIDEENGHVLDLLSLYFARDQRFEDEYSDYGYSLRKGIYLFGPVGCGKTTFMKLFKLNMTNSYRMVSCRKVADDYAVDGIEGLSGYKGFIAVNKEMYFGQESIGMCFDDLGTESSRKNFGNSLNVMETVLQDRYDNNLIGYTHVTSNLAGNEIEEFYGTRIRSRCREMFNWIEFDTSAKDRRA